MVQNIPLNIVAIQKNDSLILRDFSTGSELYGIHVQGSGNLSSIVFSPSGNQLLISGTVLGTVVYAIDRQSARQITSFPFKTLSGVYSHHGDKAYLLHSRHGAITRLSVYDTREWKLLAKKSLSMISDEVMINSNDSLIAFCSSGTIKTDNTKDLRPAMVDWERDVPGSIVFDPSNPTRAAIRTKKNTIRIIDLQEDSILLEIKGHQSPITGYAYRTDGKYLFTLDKGGILCVWSLEEKKLVASYPDLKGIPCWDANEGLLVIDPEGKSPARVLAFQEGGARSGTDRPFIGSYTPPSHESFHSPTFGYAPETGFTMGLGLTFVSQPSRPGGSYYRPSVYTFSAGYGFNGSQLLTGFNVESYIHEKWLLMMNASYNLHQKNYYFGIGDDVSRKVRQSYYSNNLAFTGELMRMIGQQFALGIGFDIRHNSSADFEEKVTAPPVGTKGGLLAGVGAAIRWDNRDNSSSPAKGHLLDLAFLRYGPWQAGDYQYNEFKADYRRYIPLGRAALGRQLALQGMTDLTWGGETPFYALPYFTADRVLRGVYRNLYIDRQMLFLQAEFRSLFLAADPRFGYVAFAGAADGAPDLFKSYKANINLAYGLGLRMQLFPKNSLQLRLDMALTNKGDFGVYAGMGAAF